MTLLFGKEMLFICTGARDIALLAELKLALVPINRSGYCTDSFEELCQTSGKDSRHVDKALMAFGQFLKSHFFKEAV